MAYRELQGRLQLAEQQVSFRTAYTAGSLHIFRRIFMFTLLAANPGAAREHAFLQN